MRPFQAALDTCLDSPFFASLSVHGLHFTVYTPSIIDFETLFRDLGLAPKVPVARLRVLIPKRLEAFKAIFLK